MWELDHKEGWVSKNWCFWIVVLEKTLESPLDSKGIKPVNSKGNQPRIFTGRTDTKAPKSWNFLMGRANSLEKTLMLWGIGGRRRRGQQRMRWLDGITDSMHMSFGWSGSWWWTGRTGMLWFMRSQRVRHDWATELNWTELNLLPLHKEGTPSIGGTREKTKVTGLLSSLLQMGVTSWSSILGSK